MRQCLPWNSESAIKPQNELPFTLLTLRAVEVIKYLEELKLTVLSHISSQASSCAAALKLYFRRQYRHIYKHAVQSLLWDPEAAIKPQNELPFTLLTLRAYPPAIMVPI